MMPYLTEQYGNPSSLYAFAQNAKEALEASRKTVADIIGAQPKEIYFTSGGSEADNQAIVSMAKVGAIKGKKHSHGDGKADIKALLTDELVKFKMQKLSHVTYPSFRGSIPQGSTSAPKAR